MPRNAAALTRQLLGDYLEDTFNPVLLPVVVHHTSDRHYAPAASDVSECGGELSTRNVVDVDAEWAALLLVPVGEHLVRIFRLSMQPRRGSVEVASRQRQLSFYSVTLP